MTLVEPTDCDYSHYLGPDYTRSGRCSTVVPNHSGFMDIMVLQAVLWGDLSFAAAAVLKKWKPFKILCDSL